MHANQYNVGFESAVPHVVSEDDVFEGYHIPKDAIVIGNVWWVHCYLRVFWPWKHSYEGTFISHLTQGHTS